MASDRMPFQAHAVRRERPPLPINQSITSDEELHYQSINHVRRKSCTTNQSITSDARAALPINQELHYGCNAVHACMRTCGRACVHAQMWMCMCACANVDVHVRMRKCGCACAHAHVWTCMCAQRPVHMCMCMSMGMCMSTCPCALAHGHMHMHVPFFCTCVHASAYAGACLLPMGMPPMHGCVHARHITP